MKQHNMLAALEDAHQRAQIHHKLIIRFDEEQVLIAGCYQASQDFSLLLMVR